MKTIIFIITCIMLAGCDTVPKVTYVDKYIYVKPPAELLKNCTATIPPGKANYIASTYAQKEQILSEYTNDLLTDISVCNVQWQTIRKWNTDQEQVYAPIKLKP
jgi:hypothetical protein